MKIIEPSVELLWITPEAEKQIERAGRTCYKSEDKITEDSSAEFCKRMVKSGHHAMIEHACASFLIVTDRGVTHEIVRHRLASYAQESTRYCNYSKGKFDNEITVIEPPNLNKNQYYAWLRSVEITEEQYLGLLSKGTSPQLARSVLPTCLKADLVMTANFREWRHFIQLRSSKAAHPQIRPIAKAVCNILYSFAPTIFGDIV